MQVKGSCGAPALLVLEDHKVFEGQGWGYPRSVRGEVVFNTAHTGYEEVITDPSYTGQIVLFTSSYIGNTGITLTDAESAKMFAEGFICKEFSKKPDNYRAFFSLEDYLMQEKKCAISGIDTRELTLHIRKFGCLRAILSTDGRTAEELIKELDDCRNNPLPAVLHQNQSLYAGPVLKNTKETPQNNPSSESKLPRARIAVVDFGIKKSIVNCLLEQGLDPYFFSPMATIEEIAAIAPSGLFLSNGPGDPREVIRLTPIRKTMEHFTGRIPTFGICMGHQLLALRFGATIRKLKFGHHAVNHPVRQLGNFCHAPAAKYAEQTSSSYLAFITSQNHNYVAEIADVSELEVTHVHLNDGTVAGMRHRYQPTFSVQFHPECHPGPHDAFGIFKVFAEMIRTRGEKP